jgi:hypothetical protein
MRSSGIGGPRGLHAGHARVGDELPHVLVGVNDDTEVDSVNGGVAIGDVHFALEILRSYGGVGFFYGVERALQPIDYVRFRSDGLLHFTLEVGGHFASGYAEQIEIGDGNVHVHFTGGTNTGHWAPGEFVLGGGLCERDKLSRDVTPFSIVALPDSFRRSLLAEQGASDDQQQNEKSFSHDGSSPDFFSADHEVGAAFRRRPFYIQRHHLAEMRRWNSTRNKAVPLTYRRVPT